MFNANYLFASLVWSSVGLGYVIYGKKQGAWVPIGAGLLMIVVSYLASTALIMSFSCAVIVIAAYYLVKQGY